MTESSGSSRLTDPTKPSRPSDETHADTLDLPGEPVESLVPLAVESMRAYCFATKQSKVEIWVLARSISEAREYVKKRTPEMDRFYKTLVDAEPTVHEDPVILAVHKDARNVYGK